MIMDDEPVAAPRQRVAALIVVTLLCGGLLPTAGVIQAEGDAVEPAPKLTELNHLIGEWRLRSFSRSDGGEFVEAESTSSYRACLMYDGRSILAEFYGESPDEFYGVHLISRASDSEFVHYYLNARLNRRLEFRGRFEGGEYHLSRPGGYGGGDFLYKEVDSEIRPDSFVKRIYKSHDDGVTWVEGNYYFRFERVKG